MNRTEMNKKIITGISGSIRPESPKQSKPPVNSNITFGNEEKLKKLGSNSTSLNLEAFVGWFGHPVEGETNQHTLYK